MNQYFWFKRFDASEKLADFYILVGMYQNPSAKLTDRAAAYRRTYLLFSAQEMKAFMEPVKHSFAFGFDDCNPGCILRTRGTPNRFVECYEGFSLDARFRDLHAFLQGAPSLPALLQGAPSRILPDMHGLNVA